jgi:hypothetical protein
MSNRQAQSAMRASPTTITPRSWSRTDPEVVQGNDNMIPMEPYDSGSAPNHESKRARRDWWVLLSIGLTFASN